MAKVVKKTEIQASAVKSEIEHYYGYKGTPMVRIKGNFFRGGFNISKNKIEAIFDNSVELKKFTNGAYDKQIEAMADDEVLQLTAEK